MQAVAMRNRVTTVIWVRNAFERFEAVQSRSTPCSFVGNHAADSAPEDLGGRAVVKRSGLRVRVHALAPELRVLDFVAVERA